MTDISISIDGQLHIRKLCERYLPEQEMVLLEWVRFARLRRAQSISISLQAHQTVILDDGQLISPLMWQSMATLLNSTNSDEIERSIDSLKPVRGIGMLAPLASGSSGFTILSPGQSRMRVLSYGTGAQEKTITRVENHTALILGQRSIDRRREMELLHHHLALVNARITINDQPLVHRQHSPNTFLSLKLYQGDAHIGTVSLPKANNHSSIELCHGDMPWSIVHYPARQGRIHWVRLDTVLNEEELGQMREQIEQANIRLLEHLRDNFNQMPAPLHNRIEELLMEWSRPLAPHFPILHMPLFQLCGEKKPVSLSALIEMSRSNALMATISESDRTTAAHSRGTLLLTRKQADFLSRSAGITLNFTGSSQSGGKPVLPHYRVVLQKLLPGLDRLLASVLSGGKKETLIPELEAVLRESLSRDPDWKRIIDLKPYHLSLQNYRGIWPSHLHKRKKEITIHRRHVITVALLRAIEKKSPTLLFVKSLIPPELS